MLFKDVVGQDELKKQLKQMALKGEIPHALLLAGEDGWGGFIFFRNVKTMMLVGNVPIAKK